MLWRLERLKLIDCRQYLFTKKLHLKELTLCYYLYDKENYGYNELKITRVMINPLLSEELHMLDFRDIVTPEPVQTLNFYKSVLIQKVQISILSICEFSSLKTFNIVSSIL